MAKNLEKTYPPYDGKDPYVYLSFRDEDKGRVRPFLKRLYQRGVRVGYATGKVTGLDEAEKVMNRIKQADCFVACTTKDCIKDTSFKDRVIYVEGLPEKKLVVLEMDELTESDYLGLGISKGAQKIDGKNDSSGEKSEDAILHAEGFTTKMIGEPPVPPPPPWAKIITIFMIVLAVAASGFLAYRIVTAEPKDAVVISDPVVRTTVRETVSDNKKTPLTEENVATVTELVFTEVPESFEELALLPNLEKITIPQSGMSKLSDSPKRDELTICIREG